MEYSSLCKVTILFFPGLLRTLQFSVFLFADPASETAETKTAAWDSACWWRCECNPCQPYSGFPEVCGTATNIPVSPFEAQFQPDLWIKAGSQNGNVAAKSAELYWLTEMLEERNPHSFSTYVLFGPWSTGIWLCSIHSLDSCYK